MRARLAGIRAVLPHSAWLLLWLRIALISDAVAGEPHYRGEPARFSKISHAGDVLAVDAILGEESGDWACTRDNRSGLVWEVKVVAPGHLRHMAHRYSWLNRDSVRNGGSSGSSAGGRCTVAGRCDTEHFAAAVNAAGLCGAHDWRLPTVKELESIVDFGRAGPAVDPAYFPNTADSYYWSATPYAGDGRIAWYVSFNHGSASHGVRDFGLHVRLVRGGTIADDYRSPAGATRNCNDAMVAATPSAQFFDHGDGTVTDRRTGLRWRRCAEGQRWSGGICTGDATLHRWPEAMALGRTTGEGARENGVEWRLPDVAELRSIVEEGCHSPAINAGIFPGSPAARFWSASPVAAYPGRAWTVDFTMGNAGYDEGAASSAVRLVRSR
jgi:hypothetical protein